MNTKEITLKNGLRTLLLNAPSNTYATVQIWFRAGSSLENEEEKGIAHFLEHMFFKGTPKYPGNEIAYEIESFGGEINAFTSFDYTCYYINCPSTEINKSAHVLLDMITHPLFKEGDLKTERDVVHEEYLRSQDNNHQYSFQKMQQDLFLPPYNSPILGSEKHIKKFSSKVLKNFRKKHYHAENILFVVAGDLKDEKRLLTTLNKFKIPRGKPSLCKPFLIKSKPRMSVHKKDVNMEQLSLIIPSLSYNDNKSPVEDLAISTLGHGEISRLYKGLVLDGQLANSAFGSTMFMRNGGTHIIKVSYPSKNRSALYEKLSSIINTVIKEGIREEELIRIKSQYLSSKVYEKESLESFAFGLGHSFAQTGDINAEERFLDIIKSVSLLRTNQALKEIFSRTVHVALQLPNSEDETLAKTELEKLQNKIISFQSKQPIKQVIKPVSSSKFDSQVKVFELKKGVKLVYRQNQVTPTFILQAYLRGGITEETKETNGIYHLVSGVITKGYNGLDYEKIKSELELRSASLGSFSGKNAYGIMMHAQSEHIDELLPHFFGALLTPDISERFIKHEKELTERSIESLKKDPVRVCFRASGKMLFGNHPYGLDPLGTEENLKKFTHEDLHRLHSSNIQNKEILLTYCGDLSISDLLIYLNPFVEKIKERTNPAPKTTSLPMPFGNSESITFDREQTHLFLSMPTGPMTDDTSLALKVITTYLSGQSSPLFEDVRDKKGLCYSAQPVHFTALEGGYFGIYIATSPEKKEKAVEALLVLLNSIAEKGISKQEFLRIKKMIYGQDRTNIQTNEDYAGLYSIPVLQDLGLDFYHATNKKIESLTHEKFQKIVRKALSVKWNSVTVGRN